jgi:hypothetical protein
MQRRAMLLLVLLLVLAVFFTTATREPLSAIKAKQKAQTETLNNLDEIVNSKDPENR